MVSYFRTHRCLVLTVFFVAIAILCIAHIGSYHLIDMDEGRYHRIPVEMVLSGDYVTPTFEYMPYFEKPIFQYWVTAVVMNLFGIHEFAGRVLPALTGFGNVVLSYILGKAMYNRRTALLAAIVTATSALNLIVASIGVLDMALTFFVNACIVSFCLMERSGNKRYLLIFYASMGLGMLTKGLIAVVFPFGILFWYVALTKKWRYYGKLWYLPGILLCLIIAVPWYYLVCQRNPDFFYFFFIREHFLRFATQMHERFHPWYYFVPVLLGGLMPWTGFLLTFFSKRGIFRHTLSKRNRQDILLLSLWAGLIYVFYSISDSKLPTYIMPCWVPLSILLAASLERCRREGTWLCHSFAVNNTLCLLFMVAGLVYISKTNYLTVQRFIENGAVMSVSLFIGTIVAMVIWWKKRNFVTVFLVLSVMAYGFGIGAHQIQGQIHDHQSAYYVSQDIKARHEEDATIIMYGRFMPGLVYYLNQPVAAANFMGELEYGIYKTNRSDLYYGSDDLRKIWNSSRHVIVVTEPKFRSQCLEILGKPAVSTIDGGYYKAYTNY